MWESLGLSAYTLRFAERGFEVDPGPFLVHVVDGEVWHVEYAPGFGEGSPLPGRYPTVEQLFDAAPERTRDGFDGFDADSGVPRGDFAEADCSDCYSGWSASLEGEFDPSTRPRTVLPPRARWPLAVEALPSDCAGAVCPEVLVVGGVHYRVSCRRVRIGVVQAAVVGDGSTEVRLIRGVDPRVALAARAECDVPGLDSPWLAITGPDARAMRDEFLERTLQYVGARRG